MKFDKKVLILCYDFPPLNTVGALRPYSWFKYLGQYGIYPIIVTRNWNANITDLSQKFSSNKEQSQVLKEDNGLIIKAAKKASLKDKIISRYGFERFIYLRKFLTIRNFFLGPFVKAFDDYHFLYVAAEKYLFDDKVDLIIATGNPHELYKEASELSKKFKIPWMPDYRDPFVYNLSSNTKGYYRFVESYKSFLEKRWTANAKHFTSVSKGFRDKIKQNISIDGSVIRNGYDDELIPNIVKKEKGDFHVAYIGTIYDKEYNNALVECIEMILDDSKLSKNIVFQFMGVELNHTGGTDKILALKKKYSKNIHLIKSDTNEKALLFLSQADIVLNLNYGEESEGVIPVKLYEYLALNKRILSFEKNEKSNNQEFAPYLDIVTNSKEALDKIQFYYSKWNQGEVVMNPINSQVIEKYSRKNQTKILADLIKKLV